MMMLAELMKYIRPGLRKIGCVHTWGETSTVHKPQRCPSIPHLKIVDELVTQYIKSRRANATDSLHASWKHNKLRTIIRRNGGRGILPARVGQTAASTGVRAVPMR